MINNEVLWHSTENSIQYLVINFNGKEYENEKIYMCNNHFAIHQKLTHCKLTILQVKKDFSDIAILEDNRSICDLESGWLEQKRRPSEVSWPKEEAARNLHWVHMKVEVIPNCGKSRGGEEDWMKGSNWEVQQSWEVKQGFTPSPDAGVLGRERISEERPIGEVGFLGVSVKECAGVLSVGAVGVIIAP